MISKYLLAALTAGLLFGAAPVAMAADTPKPPAISRDVRKALVDAQTAAGKKDYPGALAAIAEARKVSDRTPYDDLEINRYEMSVQIQNKDLTAGVAPAEAAADTDPAVIPDAEKNPVYFAAVQFALMAKHNDKAAKYAKLMLAVTPTPDKQQLSFAIRAFYAGGDYAEAIALAKKIVDADKAAGAKPSQDDLELLLNSQINAKDEVGAEETVEELVVNYNITSQWDQILSVAMTTRGMREMDYIYLGRLMVQQGYKITSNDAQLIGGAANKLALYGDADTMQKSGGPAPDPRAVADKKSIPAQITAGAKQGGEYNVKLAEVLYGYGMFPEALQAAQMAKTKGGMTDPTEADMVIGMTQIATGQYAEAGKTFAGITAANPASARVVRLWGYLAKIKADPTLAAK
jgi:tetratricopeptide (TPR) repeat protein